MVFHKGSINGIDCEVGYISSLRFLIANKYRNDNNEGEIPLQEMPNGTIIRIKATSNNMKKIDSVILGNGIAYRFFIKDGYYCWEIE